jgi:hypothetical protein
VVSADLLQIIPTRGRPNNIRRVIEAWDTTGAWDVANLLLVFDADDPENPGYQQVLREADRCGLSGLEMPQWAPMVHKLDEAAWQSAGSYFALGFGGDDHVPRTAGWAKTYVEALRALGSGIVFGDDGYQHERCPTQWAQTADIVTALGRMCPAPVEHMYSDVSVLDLGRAAGCIRYLPEVLVEHMHPIVRKADNDEQYQRVNSRDQFRRDLDIYRRWKRSELPGQAAAVKELRS